MCNTRSLLINLWTVQLLTGVYSIPVWCSSLIILCLPGNRFRREHGQILIACAWTYAAIFACSPLAHWGEYGEEPYGTACCIDWRSTNIDVMSMSYTVVLFVFCFILPCGVIITSYTLILITVKGSRRAVEQHVSGPTRMNNVQTITAKVFGKLNWQVFGIWQVFGKMFLPKLGSTFQNIIEIRVKILNMKWKYKYFII